MNIGGYIFTPFGVMLVCMTITVNGNMSCNPAEENKNHSISLTLPTKRKDTAIRIESMYQHIATCHPVDKVCRNLDSKHFNVTYTKRKDYHVVTVFIYKISRKTFANEKQWFVASYENSLMDNRSKCSITVFGKPEDIKCFNSFFNDDFCVTCIAHNIYPKGICLYWMSINNSVTKPILTEMCSTEINGNPEYFTSSCTFCLPLSPLPSGIFTASVTIYPNVTNDDSDVQYGTEFLHSFSLGAPKLNIAKESHTPHMLSKNTTITVSVKINMICYPRPKTYRLIKEDGSETIFDKVNNGNAASNGYVITFKDGETSSVTLYLNFTILKTNDFTHYLLIIDNGIIPGLEYHFSIEEGQIVNVSNVVKCVVAANVSAIALWFIWVMWSLKGKMFKGTSNRKRNVSHEEIELRHQDCQQTNINRGQLKENFLYEEIDQHQTDGTYNYDKFAEQSTETGNHYITLIEEDESESLVETSTTAKDSYSSVIKKPLSDENEYIIPVDESTQQENNGNMVLDNLAIDNNDSVLPLKNSSKQVLYYINAIEVTAAENTEYVTNLDEFSSKQKYYIKDIGESSA